MFWNKQANPHPLNVCLGDLKDLLEKASIRATLKDNALLARHKHYTVRIEVVPPDIPDSDLGPIQAVVRLVTELPDSIQTLFQGRDPSATSTSNRFAALAALYSDGETVRLGSRLTIYEAQDLWRSLYLPLLLYTTSSGCDAILGGLRRNLTNEGDRAGNSKWSARDLEHVESYFGDACVFTTGGSRFTANIHLADLDHRAVQSDPRAASFQLISDQRHPELGGGLYCVLQMPHLVPDKEQLKKICLELNKLEMAARDLPPHFGAWCPSRFGDKPAYVTFLPNALYSISGIAANAGQWAIRRARWADTMIASLSAGA